ncbi:adenylate kinase 8 isoform X6 [Ovis aries]|uniref:adenylate kinase 8 isoform X6 n=1 Tax=Ovis aries TaxID=9940 RepID=UPI0029526D10|nr:adenylate kinase 8 isoform X6 [Ovis aries]
MILDPPEVTQVAQNSSVSFRQLPQVITSNVRVVHCQNQETDMGTILLTRLQTLFEFHPFLRALFFFFFCMSLRNLGLLRWKWQPTPVFLPGKSHGRSSLNMLEQLLIHQPEDPIPFMIDHLQRDNDYVPKIVILGPPASGKTTIAMWLAKHLSTNLLSVEGLIAKEYSPLAADARMHYQKFKMVPNMLLIRLMQERLKEEDCIRRGWILDGIPETREQALTIQTLGISPRHVIVLSAPDTVLIERNLGKRIDPQTGEIYHTTFDWPPELEIQNRLMVPAGISEGETARKLLEYHRNIVRILPSYPKILKVISADQPCVDVFYQALTYVQTSHRSNAPFTPRVLLCGPVGSGKSLQAALLAQKYGLINVCCGQLLKEAVADKSKYGDLIQPFFEKEIAGAKILIWSAVRSQEAQTALQT